MARDLTQLDLNRLRARRGEKPRTKAGQVRQAWPEIRELIAAGHIFELMQNQRMIDAMNDPALQERVKQFDLERALDYALKKN